MSLLVVSQAQVSELLPMDECIGLMRDVFSALAKGDVQQPIRPIMKLPGGRGVLAMMPAYIRSPEIAATKVITVFPGNLGSPYDAHQGAVLLFAPDNGRLLAMLDASEVTAIRTAAATAVATDLLARDDACTLAILGSGIQARTHLQAIRSVRRITRTRVWSRTSERASTFANREAQRYNTVVEATASAEEAVRDADIICTATAARVPILHGSWVAGGSHINAIGSVSPSARELDTNAVLSSRMFVDCRESASNEAGDFLIPKLAGAVSESHIIGEIGDILLGRIVGRQTDAEITLFKSHGFAAQDAVVAHYVYKKALDMRVGTKLEFGGSR